MNATSRARPRWAMSAPVALAIGVLWNVVGSPAAPVAVCDLPIVRLGRVRHDADGLRAVFRIRNAGDEPLEIADINSGCGCMSARAEHRLVPPGAEGGIEVDLNLRGRRGAFRREIAVRTNDPRRPLLSLRVEAEIEAPYELDPPSVMFGMLAPDQSATQLVRLALARPGARILSAAAAAPWLSVGAEATPTGWLVRVVARPPFPPDSWLSDRITIATDDPAVSNLVVGAFAIVGPVLVVLPRELTVARGPAPPVHHLLLQGAGAERTRVVRVTAGGRELPRRERRLEDGSLQVAVPGAALEGLPNGTLLTIETDPASPRPHVVVLRVAPPGW